MKNQKDRDKELRKRIEEILKERIIDEKFLSSKSFDEIIEEISIYHQELEFQNCELLRVRDELEQSKQHYASLFNDAPIGYVLFDLNTIISVANNSFASMVGIAKGDIKGCKLTDYVDPSCQNEFYFHLQNLKKTEKTQRVQVSLRVNGVSVPVVVESNILRTDGNIAIRSAFTDITHEKSLQHELSERVKELNCLLEVSRITSKNNIPLDEILQQIAHAIPPGFQYPDSTGIVITVDGKQYKSGNSENYTDNLSIPIVFEKKMIGKLHVFCDINPKENVRGILKEEEALLIAIAKQIGQVIEAKNAASEIEKKEKYYRTLLHGLHEDIMVIDKNYIIVDVNSSFLKSSGYTKEQVVGKTCFEISHGFNEPCFKNGESCKLKEVFKTGEAKVCQHEHIHSDGSKVHIDLILSPIKDDSDSTTHVVEAARDITQLIESKRIVQESEEKYRLLITQMHQGMALHEVVKDEEGSVIDYRFLEVNESFLKHTGLTRDIIGKTVLDVLPNTESFWIERFGRVATTGEPDHFENFSRVLGKHFYVDAYSPRPNQFAVVVTDITERKNIESKLVENEERYRNLFENNHAVMMVINPKTGVIVDANPAAVDFYGWSKDELKSMNISTINTLSDDEVIAEMKLAESQNRKHFVFRHNTKAGIIKDVEVFSGPVEIQGQKLLYSFIHDITEKTKAELALKKSEEKYRRLAENTRTIFWEFNMKENRWTYISPQVETFLGYAPEEWVDFAFWANCIHPEDRDRILRTCDEASIRGEDHTLEYRFRKSKGQYCWIREEVKVEMYEGKPYFLRGTMMDITSRRKVEDALRESESNLKEAQHIAKLGRWELNIESGELMWSDTIFEIFEINPKEFGASYQAFLNAIHPEDRERVNNAYLDSLQNLQPYEIEHRLLMNDGRVKWLIELCSTDYDKNGKPYRSVGIVQEITERKLAEIALKNSEQKFQTLFKNLKVGVALISPDMKVLEANPQILEWFPVSSDQETPFCYCTFTFEPRMSPCEGCPVALTFSDGLVHEYEKVTSTPTGLMYFRVVSTPIFDDSGKVVAAVEMLDNITKRKNAEIALKESEEKHRLLFETMEQGVVYQDDKGFIIEANPAALRILGLTLDQLQGRQSTDPRWKSVKEDGNDFPGDDHPAMVAIKSGKPVTNVIMGIFHPVENEYRWILVNAVPEFKNGETKPFRVYATFTDITQRKRNEELLKGQMEFLDTLLQTIPNPVFYKDNNGVYTGCNKAFEDFLGKARNEIVGKTVFDLIKNDNAIVYHERDLELLSNPGEQHYEWIVKDRSNADRNVIFDKATLTDTKGNIIGIIGVITDITARKKAEEDIRQNAERLKALVRIFEYKAENIQSLLDYALHEAIAVTSSRYGFIHFYDETKRKLTLNSWSRDVMSDCQIANPQTCFELDKTGLWGEVIRQRKDIVINDFCIATPLKRGFPDGHVPITRYMSIPIFANDEIVAVVAVANKNDEYNEIDLNQLRLLMNSVWGLVQRVEDSEKISKLSVAVEQSSASIVITDKKGNIEYVNQKFTEITGYSVQEAIGRTPSVLKSGYHNKAFYKQLWGTILAGKDWKGQFVNKKKSGQLYWETASISPIFNLKGEITNFIAIKDDITELKRAEDALHDSELKIRRMVELSPDGIMLTDENGKIVTWNKTLELITRINAEKVIGLNVWDFHKFIKLDQGRVFNFEMVERVAMDLLSTGKSNHFQTNVIQEVMFFLMGQRRYIQLIVFVIPSEKGNMLACFARDITNHKLAEMAVKEREEKLRAIFDNSTQSFVILSTDFIIQAFNRVASERAIHFFGKEFKIGSSIYDVYPKEQVNTLMSISDRVLNNEVVSTQISLTDSADNTFWFELHFAPVYDSEKNVVGIFFNSIDITQRKLAEESMARALEREKELNELKSRFVATVSHEFRTPLASIFSNAQLLHRYHPKWDETKKNLSFNRIYESVGIMTNMLENVALIGKEQSGRLSFRPEILNLAPFVQQIVEESHLTLTDKNRVDLTIDGDFNCVLIDRVLVRHILTNLLSNAIKYSPNAPNVVFTVRKVDRYIEFEVKDFGIGIPQSEIQLIFEPFFRASNSEDFKGSGIGMSIIKQCVDVHGGKVELVSKIGEGTTVWVRLPFRSLE